MPVWGQVLVEVPESTIDPGKIIAIEVEGSLPPIETGPLVIEFEYNPRVLLIHNVRGGGEALLQCEQVDFSSRTVANEPDRAFLRVTCASVRSGAGIMMWLDLEGLRSTDTVTELTAFRAEANGQALDVEAGKRGPIVLTAPSVFFGDTESLALNFPNPFSSNTKFQFTLAADNTEVHFTVFTSYGELVYQTSLVGEQGVNDWTFNPSAEDLLIAQGTYLLLMETANGVYTSPFQILR